MVERLDYKRAGLALIAVAALVMALVAIMAGTPALANHPPDETYTSSGGDHSNDGPFWDDYFGLPDGSCTKDGSSGGSAYVMPDAPDGKVWYALVVKQGSPESNDGPDNFIWYDPVAGHSFPSAGNQAPGFSHTILCAVDEPVVTTTTVPEETTTVPEETTTTAAEETTTTVAEETTTTVAEETTTTVEILETTLTTAPAETTSSSVADTVLGTEVLPFTGVESEWTFWLATILALTGGLLVYGAKRAED